MDDTEWLRREIDQRLTAIGQQTELTRSAMEHRLNGMNEFRDQLRDQAATLMPRTEYTSLHRILEDRLAGLAERMSALELRLTSRLDQGEGASQGAADTRSEHRLNVNTLIQVLGLLATAVIVYAAFHT
jgi:hypothetical protein